MVSVDRLDAGRELEITHVDGPYTTLCRVLRSARTGADGLAAPRVDITQTEAGLVDGPSMLLLGSIDPLVIKQGRYTVPADDIDQINPVLRSGNSLVLADASRDERPFIWGSAIVHAVISR